MNFEIKKDVFIRYEKALPGENVFIFIGSRNEMLTASSEVYDILKLIREDNSKEEILEKLCDKYNDTSKDEILEGLDYTIQYLMEREVIQ